MAFIEELVEYFAELITDEQRNAVARLYGIPGLLTPEALEELRNPRVGIPEDDYDPNQEWDEPDEEDRYGIPAPDRRSGHAGGKRRPLRRPSITAVKLAAEFRKAAKEHWKAHPASRDFFLALAATHDPGYLAGLTRAGEWRRFAAAMAVLKDLDEDALAEDIKVLFGKERAAGAGGRIVFDWFCAGDDGSFTQLAEKFCRRRVDGDAGRAVLAALRGIAYPEKPPLTRNTHVFRSFLDNPDIVAIFDYYRVLRKLECIRLRTLEALVRRLNRVQP